MTDDLWISWREWEQGQAPLSVRCLEELLARLVAFERGAGATEKKAMFVAHPVYTQAACVPFWASGKAGVMDARVTLFLDRLGPAGRQALTRLLLMLELWNAGRGN